MVRLSIVIINCNIRNSVIYCNNACVYLFNLIGETIHLILILSAAAAKNIEMKLNLDIKCCTSFRMYDTRS